MADVFISYAQGDRQWVKEFATALEAEGFSVWWDPDILPGTRFREIIKKELTNAKAVIVVWSHLAVGSDWVLGEADEARTTHRLVPVLRENVKPPTEFRGIHTADLSQWRGRRENPEFRRIVTAIRIFVPPPSPSMARSTAEPFAARPAPAAPSKPATAQTPVKSKPWQGWQIAAGVLAAFIVAWLVGNWLLSEPASVRSQTGPAPAADQPPPAEALKTAPSIPATAPAKRDVRQGAANALASPAPARTETSSQAASSGQPKSSRPEMTTTAPASDQGSDAPAPDFHTPSDAGKETVIITATGSGTATPPPPPPDPDAIKEQRARELEKAWGNPN